MIITQEWLEKQGYLAVRRMKNGKWIGISPQIYTTGLVVGLDEWGYEKRYCYESLAWALVAVSQYEGEGDPIGPWVKEKGAKTGERLGPGALGMGGEPDGEPTIQGT